MQPAPQMSPVQLLHTLSRSAPLSLPLSLPVPSPRGKNEEFLGRTAKYAERRKWSHLLSAFKTGLAKVAPLLEDEEPPAAEAAGAEGVSNGAGSGGGGGGGGGGDEEMVEAGDRAASHAAASTSTPAPAGKGSRKAARSHGARGGGGGGAAAAAAAPATPAAEAGAGAEAAAAAAAAGGSTADAASPAAASAPSRKRRKVGVAMSEELRSGWRRFASDLAAAERAAAAAEGGFAFAFVEGALVTALREGWWLLLDEINLAPPEVLERIAGVLETSGSASVAAAAAGTPVAAPESSGLLLVERGDAAAVPRHPGFRLVAAMNPATDAGKHDLPGRLRARFTELWVAEPSAREDLCALVAGYLAGAAPAPPVDAVVDFYRSAKAEADQRLTDGSGQRPAYSLRTLCRALDYARTVAPTYGLQRALADGLAMSFLTQLSPEAAPRMEALLLGAVMPGTKPAQAAKSLARAPPAPAGDTHVLFESFWLERGPEPLPAGGREDDGGARRFVLTPSVRKHLANLARAALVRKHPILLQGPTSAGKTSLVSYLAAQTGHAFVRINNHQHTDLQEYLGSWVPDETGRLVFREGALVRALRAGHWLVLDELNLAPTEVLEALNRWAAGPCEGGPRRLPRPAVAACSPTAAARPLLTLTAATPPRPHPRPQAARRQPRAVCAGAAGDGAAAPPLHAVRDAEPAGRVRGAQGAVARVPRPLP
jgi:MoxR-like ATPase